VSDDHSASVPAPESGAEKVAPIRVAAMDLLARREHSLSELRQKLRRRFGDERLVEGELQRLAGEGLLSDERFGESFARQRVGRGYGPARLRLEMRGHGLSDADIESALESVGIDWCAQATAVYHKKFGSAPASDLRERARRARFMQYRGFDSDHYRHLLDV
jgi:regulatory protein